MLSLSLLSLELCCLSLRLFSDNIYVNSCTSKRSADPDADADADTDRNSDGDEDDDAGLITLINDITCLMVLVVFAPLQVLMKPLKIDILEPPIAIYDVLISIYYTQTSIYYI